jgi:hypothetical protein
MQPKTTGGIVYFLVNGKGVGLHDEKSQDDMALVESTISHEEFNVYTPK